MKIWRMAALLAVLCALGCEDPAVTSNTLEASSERQTPFAPSTHYWQLGRNASGELIVNAGPAFGNVAFEQEQGNYVGSGARLGLGRCSGTANAAAGCPTCNMILYDSVVDNYLAGGLMGDDVMHVNTNRNAKHFLLKNAVLKNAFRTNGAHCDALQYWNGLNDGGSLVVQDSELLNSDTQIGQLNKPALSNGPRRGLNFACADSTREGYVVFQGARIGNEPAFAAECIARGNAAWACNSGNQFLIGEHDPRLKAVWLIETHTFSGTAIRVHTNGAQKIVVVASTPQFNNGWPEPLSHSWIAGNGTCPNGAIANWPGGINNARDLPTYCYTSIQRALLDGHAEPPFIRLSRTGWE